VLVKDLITDDLAACFIHNVGSDKLTWKRIDTLLYP